MGTRDQYRLSFILPSFWKWASRAPLRTGSFHKEQVIVIKHRRIEEHAIKTIEQAAMARDQFTRILHLCPTLEHRLAKIAHNSQHAHDHSERNRSRQRELREEPVARDDHGRHIARQPANRTLNGLSRTDARSKLAATKSSARVIGSGVSRKDYHEEERKQLCRQLTLLWKDSNCDNVSTEERDIQYTEDAQCRRRKSSRQFPRRKQLDQQFGDHERSKYRGNQGVTPIVEGGDQCGGSQKPRYPYSIRAGKAMVQSRHGVVLDEAQQDCCSGQRAECHGRPEPDRPKKNRQENDRVQDTCHRKEARGPFYEACPIIRRTVSVGPPYRRSRRW